MKASKHRHFILLNGLLAAASAGAAQAAPPVDESKMTVYRCVDADGKVSLQDVPCAAGARQEVQRMVRPKDAASADSPAIPPVDARPIMIVSPAQAPEPRPPPPELYRCTDFDGKVREAEYYDPKPRCVPLWVLGYESRSQACRWVEDSCVRYEGKELCDRWEARRKQTALDVSHSDSSGAPYLKSELARFTQIVNTSCRR
jgi:hypothetical protein